MKTKSAALDALKTKVLSMHPYKVPEFIALPVSFERIMYSLQPVKMKSSKGDTGHSCLIFEYSFPCPFHLFLHIF